MIDSVAGAMTVPMPSPNTTRTNEPQSTDDMIVIEE